MKTTKYAFALILLLLSFNSFSRNNIVPNGGRATGMGNAFVSQFNEFSAFQNQAGLAKLDRTSISFFYENKLFVKEFSLQAGIISFPTKSGNFAFQYNSFGPSRWNESNGGISYAKQLTDKISGGIQLSYYGTRLPEINSTLINVGFEFGAIYQLSDKSYLGAHIANPYSQSITTYSLNEHIPYRVKFGGHTAFNDQFILSYEIEKVEFSPIIYKVGGQWEASDNFYLRAGLNTGPSNFFTGLGFETKYFTIDAAFSYFRSFGYAPSISVIFSYG